MNRTTAHIPNDQSPFGSSPTKEVFVPRMPMINKVTGNLAGTHKKIHVAEQVEQVNQQMAYKVQYFSRKFRKQFKNI